MKRPSDSCWYCAVPIGRNKLSKAVSEMCKECGIGGFKTNHSLRATAATRLYSAGIDEQLVMERTGHRSLEGIRSYKRTSAEQKEVVSDLLTKKPCNSSSGDITMASNAVSQPCYASKSGAFYFTSCTNVNININSYSSQ